MSESIEEKVMNSPFVQFHSSDPKNLNDFFAVLGKNNISIRGGNLMKILKTKTLSLQINEAIIDGVKVFLILVVGHLDRVLMSLGEKYGMPRGFQIIWIPDIMIHFFGFYPKFDNDEIQQQYKRDFSHVKKLTVAKKFSGYLGQCPIFPVNGKTFYTVLSKNSCNSTSPFVNDAKHLFSAFLNNENIEKFSGICLCGEVISFRDMCHGAQPLAECISLTCIGKGTSIEIGKDTSEKKIDVFVGYLDPCKLATFCQEHNLPTSPVFVIEDPIEIKNFMDNLNLKRDSMDNSYFDKIVDDCKGITVFGGSVDHQKVLGNRIEGVVIHFLNDDDTKEVEKYKFPNYTSVTMLLRTLISRCPHPSMMMDLQILEKIQIYVDRWCTTTGKKSWFDQCMRYVLQAQKTPLNKENPVGFHIRVADSVAQELLNLKNNKLLEFFKKEVQLVNSTKPTVYVVVGAIGAGKSTTAEKLVSHLRLGAHIDGDDLIPEDDLVPENVDTKKLGQERNVVTNWTIFEALRKGYTPVISTGGGALYTSFGKRKVFFIEEILDKLGYGVDLQTIIVTDDEKNPFELHKNEEFVSKVCQDRKNRGIWANDVPEKKIVIGSARNAEIAEGIMQLSNVVHFAPLVVEGKIDSTFDYKKIVESAISPKASDSVEIKQHRILTGVKTESGNIDSIGHVTLKYSNKSFELKPDSSEFKSQTSPGKIYTQQIGKKILWSVAIPDTKFHDDKSTHITMNPGKHKPALMRDVALALQKGEKTITLDGQKYDFDQCDVTECKINFFLEFYL